MIRIRMAEIQMKAVRNSNKRIRVRGNAETCREKSFLMLHNPRWISNLLLGDQHWVLAATSLCPSTSWTRSQSPGDNFFPFHSRGSSKWSDSHALSFRGQQNAPQWLAIGICWRDSRAGDKRSNDVSWMDVWTFQSLCSENITRRKEIKTMNCATSKSVSKQREIIYNCPQN